MLDALLARLEDKDQTYSLTVPALPIREAVVWNLTAVQASVYAPVPLSPDLSGPGLCPVGASPDAHADRSCSLAEARTAAVPRLAAAVWLSAQLFWASQVKPIAAVPDRSHHVKRKTTAPTMAMVVY